MSAAGAADGEPPQEPAWWNDRADPLRDLLVSVHTPALRSGMAMRTYSLVRALAVHRAVEVLYVRFGAAAPDSAFEAIEGAELHEVVPSRGAARALAYARARVGGVPPALARAVSAELVAAVDRLAAAPRRGRVIADGPAAAAASLSLARRRAVIYNAHNLESAFRHELHGASARDHARLVGFERRLLERSEECWMVSDADLAGARELAPHARLRYVPNAVDVSAIEPIEPNGERRSILFLASFSYEPNRVALRHLLEQVMPRVWMELPDATLSVVGAGLEPLEVDRRVQLHGFVDDLRCAYAGCSCAVVPLLQGGGSPLKLIEALAYGLPVVATSKAVAGLRLADGVDCIVADGAQALSAALVRLLVDGAGRIAANGRAVAQRLYSIEALAELVAPSAAHRD
ncbi:MAG: glycosyltransferase family 4 protein [Solirubrobacteraceae bacterium]